MNQKPNPASISPKADLQLPYRPYVAAGWKIPGIGRYKINQWLEQVRAVNQWEENRKQLTDPQLRKEFLSLIYRAKSGEDLGSLLPECYSCVREACRRKMNMRHYDWLLYTSPSPRE